MSKTVANEKIQVMVKRQVAHALREILTDPDFGLELSLPTAKRLAKSAKSFKSGSYKPLGEILKQYQ
jgi:hypothetical protein